VVLGQPTLRGRHDLAQHFAVSAYLVAMGGSQQAESIGLAKELLDAKRGSGFSFADLAANRAGAVFAGSVMNKKFSLPALADGFSAAAFMPAVDDLPEGLTAAELHSKYGAQEDGRFQQQLQAIDQRVLHLPAYRVSGIALER
jgi:hypothetical protein